MEIHFISSLTADDEDAFAPAVLTAISALLDQLPIAYTVRIETTGSRSFQHSHLPPETVESSYGTGHPDPGARLQSTPLRTGLAGPNFESSQR
jgi:hypothetical protein